MLVVHWSPVNNSKNILKNGINKGRNGVYCFPITGHVSLDRWWMKALKRFRKDGKRYNGFIFRVGERDLPAYFGHFMGATTNDEFDKSIKTLEDLGKEIQNTIIWRIGESTLQHAVEWLSKDHDFIKLGREELQKRPTLYKDTLTDAAFMEYILEDYQIVLNQSIDSNRIIRVIPPTEEFGRVLYKNKKQRYIEG
ncbi:hypothetical protein H8B09_07575 [Paenibacillus sp. PR3]|uniref:Uncharacterized protein n=1 Tax=Paenibacillus terricola TaxID=2763503 RepID=A0ABR8MWS6_9BACL|nr:hypothetical protein [Paenibacillus terricola]MBD3918604.1 hypothetical protein [Paenibacillus terricola]